jgi:hypothetical protein
MAARLRYLVPALVAAAAFAVPAANAGLIGNLLNNCPSGGVQVFAPWGDTNNYLPAPNGGFEFGSTGWSLSGGASVVGGNDPFALSGPGSASLRLPKGASATINVCYGLTYPAVRFVGGGVDGTATIHVRVVSHSLLGIVSILDGGTFQVADGWDAAPKLSTLFSAVAALVGTKSMSLVISSDSGTAQIDDVYVDPFLSK